MPQTSLHQLLIDTIKNKSLSDTNRSIEVKNLIADIREANDPGIKIHAIYQKRNLAFEVPSIDGADEEEGAPALHWAALYGQAKIVQQLIEAKANPNAHNKYGGTALTVAAATGHTLIVKQLIEAKANLNAQNQNGSTALIMAANKGHPEIVKLLIEAKANPNAHDEYGGTALTVAAVTGHTLIVKQLIEAKANLNAQNQNGRTALIHAADQGHTEIVKLFIDAKANLNAQDKSGDTPLHWAAYKGRLQTLKALIEAKADLHINNNDGNTAVDEAIRTIDLLKETRLATVSLLLDAGASFNRPNSLFELLQSCNQADPQVLTSLEYFCKQLTNQAKHKELYFQASSYLSELKEVNKIYQQKLRTVLKGTEIDMQMPEVLSELIFDYDNPLQRHTTFLTPQHVKNLYEEYTSLSEAKRNNNSENSAAELKELKQNGISGSSQLIANPSNARRNEDARNGIVLFGMATTFGLAITFITGFMAKDPLNDTLVFTLLLCAEIMGTLFLGTVTALMISDLSHAEQPQPSL